MSTQPLPQNSQAGFMSYRPTFYRPMDLSYENVPDEHSDML